MKEPKFKIGQKVKVIKDAYLGPIQAVGTTHTVESIDDNKPGETLYRISPSNLVWFADELEAVD